MLALSAIVVEPIRKHKRQAILEKSSPLYLTGDVSEKLWEGCIDESQCSQGYL